MLLRDLQTRELVVGRDRRQQVVDQVRSALVQRACRIPVGLPLDPAVGRVRRGGGQPGQLEGPGVDPDAVAVAVGEVRRAVGNHGVEQLPGRRPERVVRHRPAAAEDPRQVRVRLGVPADRVERVVGRLAVVDVAAQHVDPGHHGVHVRVLEPRKQQAAGEIDHLGARPAQRQDLVVVADGGDAAAAHSDRPPVRPGETCAPDRSADEDGVDRGTTNGGLRHAGTLCRARAPVNGVDKIDAEAARRAGQRSGAPSVSKAWRSVNAWGVAPSAATRSSRSRASSRPGRWPSGTHHRARCGVSMRRKNERR